MTTGPVLLLIAGGGQSMVWWEVGFCSRLASGGRYVVRYDHRDTGRSTTSPAGRPDYTSADLATDPLRIMEHLRLERAHLVGMSMGGGIAQYLAVEHAERVASLVLVETSLRRPAPRPAADVSGARGLVHRPRARTRLGRPRRGGRVPGGRRTPAGMSRRG